MSQKDIEENMERINRVNEEHRLRLERRRKLWLSVGKWFADHLVELAALVLSIIALINTLK